MGPVSGGTAETTATAKQVLREQVRRHRRDRAVLGTVAARDADGERLADAVLAAVSAHRGGRVCRVAAYEARPAEPPTRILLERLGAQGYEVIVPVTLPDLDLDWRPAFDAEASRLGRDAISDAAVVVVPALAVDRRGRRLGQGGGSYDRALPRRGPHALVVALLHDGELLEGGAVPVRPHDVAVDVVVTPTAGWVPLSPEG